jgi:ketosteroid isomerase-like protein
MKFPVLFAIACAALVPLPVSAQAATTATPSADKAAQDAAMDAFGHAWTSGDWEPFTGMFADDFVFEFPAGPHSGRFTGPRAKEMMLAWRHDHEKNDRITELGENLRLHDGDWVVACFRSTGVLFGKPYFGVVSVMLKLKAGKIVEYREYLGDLGPGPGK